MINTFSHNALNAFEQCPRKFKFQFIEKVEMPRRVPADIYLGQTIHRTLARLYEIVQEGKVPELQYLLDFYATQWEDPERDKIEITKDYMTMTDYSASGKAMLERYYRKHSPFDASKTIGIERRLTGSVPGSSYQITGYIDKLARLGDGALEICDYKTGKALPRGGHDPLFYSQMGLYQLLVKENFPDAERIELVQHFLKLDETIRYCMPEEKLDEIAEEIRATISLIKRAASHDDFAAREGPHCDYCEYIQLCPLKRHRLVLEDEAGEVSGEEKSTAQKAREMTDSYLELDEQVKLLKTRQEALKQDLVAIARELNLQRLIGAVGAVSISIRKEEKFPSKSDDPDGFAELSQLVRELQLDTCLKVDDTALRDIFAKKRLPQDQLDRLAQYVVIKELVVVRPQHPRRETEDSVK